MLTDSKNTARGALVVKEDVAEALKSGKLRGYGGDGENSARSSNVWMLMMLQCGSHNQHQRTTPCAMQRTHSAVATPWLLTCQEYVSNSQMAGKDGQ
jgi:lactate dehydrogenase-like 2-hydroxyacid dehydrogenase